MATADHGGSAPGLDGSRAGRRKAEGGRRKAEGRRRKAEGGRQKVEGGRGILGHSGVSAWAGVVRSLPAETQIGLNTRAEIKSPG
ncbi:MAG: hypothetical protein EA368_08995 [Leptolyngbya sp. DLM2.Bin27]|nr:MAG: hypothetical protein EA368_08995 [Leptolyngbya sp. DLM2.Bin27]